MPKKVNPALVDQQMQQYAEQTVTPHLNNMFLPSEGPGNDHRVDRGNHIVIDGRTVREMLIDEFAKTHDPSDGRFSIDFENYYYKEGKAIVSQRVAAAVMAGRQVDVYVPDPKTGKTKDTPTRMTKSGYEPDPIKRPMQMTRWQKFWSKFGFYKAKVAEQQRQQTEYAKRDAARDAARDRVKLYNRASRIGSLTLFSQNRGISEAWAEKYPERKGIDTSTMKSHTSEYRLNRQGMALYVNLVLARKRNDKGEPLYSNEQLFNMSDPNMQQARADAAEEIYQHDLKHDVDWLLTLQHDGNADLTARINEQGKKVSFSHPDLTEQRGYREYVQLSNTAFELSQEVVATGKELDAKYGKGEHDAIASGMGELPNVVKIINSSIKGQCDLMSGLVGTGQRGVRGALGTMFAGQAALQHFQKLQKNPKVSPMDYAKGDTMDVLYNVQSEAASEDDDLDVKNRPPVNKQSVALEKEYLEDPAKVAKQISTGAFAKRVQLQSLHADKKDPEPVKLNVLDAQTAERQMKQEKGGAGMEV
ncbi:MAG: hypothetical protein IJV41_12850 [Oscillospiraceae bacterium]|nr:hypothetical protein [Oscillospiraceae bacterium]